jgi:hypothetical protein
MNTRLLMTMHVKVGTLLNIGAGPHGTRRTAPLDGGRSKVRIFAAPSCRAAAQTGSSFARTAYWKWICGSPSGLMMRADLDAIVWPASRATRGYCGDRTRRNRGALHYYFRTMPRFETAHPLLVPQSPYRGGERRPPPEGPIYTIHEVL